MKTINKGKKNKALRVVGIASAALTACGGAAFLFLKKKRHFTAFMIAAVILSSVMMYGMTAYAYSDEGAEISLDTEPDEIIIGEDLEVDLSEPYDPEQPPKLTPPGNLTLVDDLSGVQTESKQFITVITKSGNYFYIIIDRAGDKENVHFLNLVDEYDLLAILEGEKTVKPPAPVQPAPEQTTTTTESAPAEPKSSNTAGMLIMVLAIAAIGGGAFYYFKVLKPKQGGGKKSAGTTELDEFDFDADEDDFISNGTGEQDSADYGGDADMDEDIPDFTAADDNESEDI
jgi:hypothetical protein